MSEESIFNGETPPVVEPPASNPTSTVPTEVADLVGEGKKYRSVEDALKSVPHAQKHIETLEQENARIKSELEKRRTAEELLEEIRNGISQPAAGTPAPTFDPNTIESTVEQLLARKEAKRSADSNISQVVSKFQEVFGDKEKAEQEYIKIAAEAGLSVQMLNNLAATSPAAVLKLAGIGTAKQQPVGKPSSTVNTESFSQGNTQQLSSKVPAVGSTTKDLMQAVRNAREKVMSNLK
jgi:hypothetical protein